MRIAVRWGGTSSVPPIRPHRSLYVFGIIIGIAVVGLMSSGVAAYAASQAAEHVVSIYEQRQKRIVVTRARTVRQALELAGIRFDDSQDLIEPGLETELYEQNLEIKISRPRPVMIVDGPKRMKITTPIHEPRRIIEAAGLTVDAEDRLEFLSDGDFLVDGTSLVLHVTRDKKLHAKTPEVTHRDASAAQPEQPNQPMAAPKPANPLTKAKGAQIFTDSKGVAHRETYYDLPMNIVIGACGRGGYAVRADGAKIDKDGYVLVAANYRNYPRCSVVETSLGPGKVYDTGGFAARHPHGFDLATDWTNRDGR